MRNSNTDDVSDVFRTRPGYTTASEPWCERAEVYGPFHTVTAGLTYIDDHDSSLPDAIDKKPMIFAVIGGGAMYKIAVQIEHKLDIQPYTGK